MINPGDLVTWRGWGHVAHTFVNCKGKVVKVLGDENGWSIVEKSSGSRHYVQNKKLTVTKKANVPDHWTSK